MTEDVKDLLVEEVEINSDPNRCTKNDEFKTSPCTCPECMKAISDKPDMTYTQKGVVVGDNNLVPGEIHQWIGYTFVCPACKTPSILDAFNYCPNCGTRVLIRSYKVTEFIEKIQEKNASINTNKR